MQELLCLLGRQKVMVFKWSLACTSKVRTPIQGFPVQPAYTTSYFASSCHCHAYHWLTTRKGVHLFRYFLPSMRTPLWLFLPHAYMQFYCVVVYALSAVALNAWLSTMDPMCTPQNNRNAYAWRGNNWTGVHIVDRKYLNRCTCFLGVSQWANQM